MLLGRPSYRDIARLLVLSDVDIVGDVARERTLYNKII